MNLFIKIPDLKNSHFPSVCKTILLGFLITLFLISCSASRKLKQETDLMFEGLPAFKTGFSGFVLYDPEKEKILYQRNGEKYFTPASNTKLFTFYTGLKILGDSVPALKYAVHNDSLVFWGTGDPSFLHEKFPRSEVLSFFAERDEKLFYAPPKYEIEHFGPGWSWDDYNYYYSVEKSAFPLYGNYVRFTFNPQVLIPEMMPSFFKHFIRRDSTITGTSSKVKRNRHRNYFRFQHRLGNPKEQQEVPFIHTPQLAIRLLSDTIGKPVGLIREVPDVFRPVRTLQSIPADSLYKRMLQVSDNFIAEQILLMSAQKISDTLKSEIAIDYMKENYLGDLPDEPKWVDGSGLSIYNKFTPRSIVSLLERISKEISRERLFELFPAGGESGTIKNFYKAEKPYIFAKTGTLSNVHALSGFLRTRKGKILIFSLMNNNYTVSSAEIKKGMEKILRNIHLNYQ